MVAGHLQLHLLFAAIFLLPACERAPDLKNPKSYAKEGIAFSLPSNWSVTEDVTEPGEPDVRRIFVESTGNAIVIIQRFRPAIHLTTEEYAKVFLATTVKEAGALVELGKFRPIKASPGAFAPVRATVAASMRDGVEYSFSISLLGQKVPHTARVFRVEGTATVAYLVVQAATEDWAVVAPGFELVAASLTVQ